MQCWTQASKPESLKQDTKKEKENLYSTLKNKLHSYLTEILNIVKIIKNSSKSLNLF